jgi:hypothetical protein
MASIITGSGNYGVYIEFDDGDTEKSWHKTEEERDKVYNNSKVAAFIKEVKKINR